MIVSNGYGYILTASCPINDAVVAFNNLSETRRSAELIREWLKMELPLISLIIKLSP
jgi:hypothetical protein